MATSSCFRVVITSCHFASEVRFVTQGFCTFLSILGSCVAFECKPGSDGQSELCTLTKREARIWDRLTEDPDILNEILTIDYNRWEEADEDTPEHSYPLSKLVTSIDSDMAFRKELDAHRLVVVDMSPKWCTACLSKIKDITNAARALKNEAHFIHLDSQV